MKESDNLIINFNSKFNEDRFININKLKPINHLPCIVTRIDKESGQYCIFEGFRDKEHWFIFDNGFIHSNFSKFKFKSNNFVDYWRYATFNVDILRVDYKVELKAQLLEIKQLQDSDFLQTRNG